MIFYGHFDIEYEYRMHDLLSSKAMACENGPEKIHTMSVYVNMILLNKTKKKKKNEKCAITPKSGIYLMERKTKECAEKGGGNKLNEAKKTLNFARFC